MKAQAPSVLTVSARPGKQDQGRHIGMAGARAGRHLALLSVALVGLLGACGQKGPLVLPATPSPLPPAAGASVPATGATERALTPPPAPPRTP